MPHGFGLRIENPVPLSPTFKPGMFGRMFPLLAPLETPRAHLVALGKAMLDAAPAAPSGDNTRISAGFTYLGQFVDHDITFDTTPMPEVKVDPLAVHNFRTPTLDLDCLYGGGPGAHPFLYDRADRDKFLIGTTRQSPDAAGVQIPPKPNDLPRNAQGFAIVGDPRNDENIIVAQTHLLLLKFHNKVVERLQASAPPVPKAELFARARQIVTWHYQWVVLNDFVRKIVNPAVLDGVLQNGRRFYLFAHEPFIPVEFAVAAYRLHTMVREAYDFNRVFGPGPGRLAPGSLPLLFRFTGNGGDVPLPSNWIIDWRRFFDLNQGAPNAVPVNPSRKMDPFAAPALHALQLPESDPDMRNLPVRNLIRGNQVGLPSGQAVAAALGVPALTSAQLESGPDGQVAKQHGMHLATPLFYYIMKEAQQTAQSGRLGLVGSHILSEVFVGLLQGDSASFMAQAPEWRPNLPALTAGTFTMADIINFVGEINPIGG